MVEMAQLAPDTGAAGDDVADESDESGDAAEGDDE